MVGVGNAQLTISVTPFYHFLMLADDPEHFLLQREYGCVFTKLGLWATLCGGRVEMESRVMESTSSLRPAAANIQPWVIQTMQRVSAALVLHLMS